MSSDVNEILENRGSNYGTFFDNAQTSQGLKNVIIDRLVVNGNELAVDQLEALDMICAKISRIVGGDPNYIDSWTDIAGYATLVAKRLQGEVI